MTVPRIAMIMVLGASTGCLDSGLGDVKSVNAAASQLVIEPTIVDADAAPPDGMVPVVVQFFQSNEYVKLDAATLAIDGMAVPYGSMGYATRIPIVAPGGNITFTYSRGGTTTQFAYRVPPRPTITAPMANEVVPRSINLMIAYSASTGQAVRPLASDASLGTSGIEQTDNGMAFLDVTGLRPGAGTIGVARRYVTTPPGTGFQSAAVTYTITSVPVPVTWQ
ncbi:MAG TPA: hypothetical protein VHT91_22855 [Kofleriaceae bacterium]|jgi:hypothetical protein|nr:hypothetical protein [Kofleriaceae bacterium]